jgi:hypothetical protein
MGALTEGCLKLVLRQYREGQSVEPATAILGPKGAYSRTTMSVIHFQLRFIFTVAILEPVVRR